MHAASHPSRSHSGSHTQVHKEVRREHYSQCCSCLEPAHTNTKTHTAHTPYALQPLGGRAADNEWAPHTSSGGVSVLTPGQGKKNTFSLKKNKKAKAVTLFLLCVWSSIGQTKMSLNLAPYDVNTNT